MRNLAGGLLDTAVGNQNRADEIGEMARALDVFKRPARRRRSSANGNPNRNAAAADAERDRNEAEKPRRDSEIAFAVRAGSTPWRRIN
ncbi:hypothetical protein QN224_28675 [Sinorhizobium sp. 8-89]|nr:hypothetical protein [Sinorhizobium sp. 7-81]MDK1389371.1 hypothetical protein [Sinorhizobium sp. 7-81]